MAMTSRVNGLLAMHLISHFASTPGRGAMPPKGQLRNPVISSVITLSILSTRLYSSKKVQVSSTDSLINIYIDSLRNQIPAFPWNCCITTSSSHLTSSARNIKMKIYPRNWMHGSRSSAQKNRMKSCVCVTRFCSLGIFTGIFTRSVRTRRMLWGFFQRRLRNWIEIQ